MHAYLWIIADLSSFFLPRVDVFYFLRHYYTEKRGKEIELLMGNKKVGFFILFTGIAAIPFYCLFTQILQFLVSLNSAFTGFSGVFPFSMLRRVLYSSAIFS